MPDTSAWYPALVRAQPAKLKVGVLLPKSGVLAQLGHLPTTGESFRWRGHRFEVVDLDGRRIDKLLVQRLASA